MFLPLLEAFLESFFCKASQWPLQFGEQPEITRSHVLESREPGEQLECHVWPGNSESGVMNEPGYCHELPTA
jgi:hypothetical protein